MGFSVSEGKGDRGEKVRIVAKRGRNGKERNRAGRLHYFDRCHWIREVTIRSRSLTIFRSAWLNRTLEFCGLYDGRLQLSILQDTVDRASCCSGTTNVEFQPFTQITQPIDDLVNLYIMYMPSRFQKYKIFENLYNKKIIRSWVKIKC